jgi:hypothetical protein
MQRDDHERTEPQARTPPTESGAQPRAGGFGAKTVVVTLLLAGVLTFGGVQLVRIVLSGTQTATARETTELDRPKPVGPALFKGWSAPDVVLLLTGQQHGYMLPCGCTSPQRGGLERRYNLLQQLKGRGWPVVALDLGDIAQLQGPQNLPNVQGLSKYIYSMQALKLMDYAAVGIGEYEMALPLKQALDNYALNEPEPRVLCANLKDLRTPNSNFEGEVEAWKLVNVPGKALKVGVISVVGPTVQGKLKDSQGKVKDPLVRFDQVPAVLPLMLKEMQAKKPDLKVMLYQGTLTEAKACAEAAPALNVILCLSDSDEPSARPEMVKDTMIVSVGHKGKHVGVVGIFANRKSAKAFDLKYQMATMDPEFKTPTAKEGEQPIVALMERYTEALKDGNYLAKYTQGNHALQVAVPNAVPSYVGSEKCKKCHEHAYDVWTNSRHAHAYQTLVDAKHPSLRQYDGECIVCHVTGFTYKTGFRDAEKTPLLMNVGCESCHGPASEHLKKTEDPKWHALMNPWKAKPNENAAATEKRELVIGDFCQKCHDQENDMHWDYKVDWAKIAHPTPP